VRYGRSAPSPLQYAYSHFRILTSSYSTLSYTHTILVHLSAAGSSLFLSTPLHVSGTGDHCSVRLRSLYVVTARHCGCWDRGALLGLCWPLYQDRGARSGTCMNRHSDMSCGCSLSVSGCVRDLNQPLGWNARLVRDWYL